APWRARAALWGVFRGWGRAGAGPTPRRVGRGAPAGAPGAPLILTGCYAQTGGGEAASLPGVALVVGPQDRDRLPELALRYLRDKKPRRIVRPPGSARGFIDLPVRTFGGHTRAWLKIQDGCQQFCTYCQIPLARGPVRSLPLARVIEEAGGLAEHGYRELVLTGIHLGAYGTDLPDRPTLARVVASLADIRGLVRLRLGSVEPNDVTPELIEALAASPQACPHLHLPLQSGDDATLARMGRPYRAADYGRLLASLRRELPGLAVSTDLMVGFPGETEAQFVSSLSFAREMGFSRLHIFPFSARPGTAAAAFENRPPRRVIGERARRAAEAAAEMSLRYNRSLLGTEVMVLVEECGGGLCSGLAGQYVEVRFAGGADLRNAVVPVRVDGADAEALTGTLAD
ncbi:MAG: MiaB/RimO family radical SAM methylthiotransferase, partial [Patescibacteria group bacterium]